MRRCSLLLLALPLLAAAQYATSPAEERYAYARVHLPGPHALPALWDAGADDHALRWTSAGVETVLPHWGIEQLRQHGFTVDVLLPDMAAYSSERLRLSTIPSLTATDPRHFRLGSMGGFYRLEEIEEEFARMQQFFPAAVAGPDTLGFSVEGRPIVGYRFTLGDTPEALPAVLYTALHHAREPGGVTTLVYFLWSLLERAATGDEEALYLLRHRLLYVVPVVNPDGYAFNQASRPEGGGMWRKNRRRNPDGSFGVDLNRNYGPATFWDAPNQGSSTNPRSDVYRGPAPFSEPEIQAIQRLCLNYPFRIAVNYHTYSNLLIYPYSARDSETPDSTLYRLFCAEATRWNLYSCGRDLQTVGYSARGVSDDWMYDTTDGKPKTIALTPEVGTPLDGFWPPAERILSHARENLWLNLQAAWSAGANLRPLLSSIEWGTPLRLWLQICNIGVSPLTDTASVRLRPLSEGISLAPDSVLLTTATPGSCQSLRWELTLHRPWNNGDSAGIEVQLLQHGVLRRDTLWFRLASPTIHTLFATAADTALWQLDGWGPVFDPQLGGWTLTESPVGNYPDSATLYATLRRPLLLDSQSRATLEFWARWSLEANYDFALVEASPDSGRTWIPLRSERMKPGLGLPGSRQNRGSWGFDGNFPLWTVQRCDLSAFAGRPLLLRLGLLSDPAFSFDGFSVAQIRVFEFPPKTPSGVERSETAAHSAKLFPNPLPRGGELFVQLPVTGLEFARAAIVTPLGHQLWSGTLPLSDGIGSLRLPAELASGVYVVRLWGGGRLFSAWFVLF